jgi:hemin uptake protein HemP
VDTIMSEGIRDAHHEMPVRYPAPSVSMPPARTLDSRRLFEGAQEIRITHAGQEYRLRQTRNDKLILTK